MSKSFKSKDNLSDIWKLKRRGKRDSARHKELVKEAIKKNGKKNKDENKFYLQMSSSVYQEMSPDCFKLTIEKSKHLPVEQMKQQLKQFEVNNEQKKN